MSPIRRRITGLRAAFTLAALSEALGGGWHTNAVSAQEQ